ncbi:GTP cyclohydrolase II [Lutibacter sp. A80]|uniref:GTP cyclohydrolase II n=1 Tax=Lutibacter sp. A80 TaxID=2918453 RepID=UPI001F06BFA7|nr:GTP cyclohydrolase II [Lutibacter sp. A80]UMB59124.1 GTP cyclohydrolase II [Lutibacter sp. A80]
MSSTKLTLIQGEKVKLPTKYGNFELIVFKEKEAKLEHIALLKGNSKIKGDWLTRVHSACATGDLFGSLRCDCGEQLAKSLQLIEKNGKGVLIYLMQEGRGIGLLNKIKAYKLQEAGMDTVEANVHLGYKPDERNYDIAALILEALNIGEINLLTNNPDKVIKLEENGIQIKNRIPLKITPNAHNIKYFETKVLKMGHL